MTGGKVVSKTTGSRLLESHEVVPEATVWGGVCDYQSFLSLIATWILVEKFYCPPPAIPLVQSNRICSNFIKVIENI